MGMFVNVILLMLSSVVLYIGIQFYITNQVTSNQTRYYVLGYSICSAVWCFCYGLIGLSDNFDAAAILRTIGVLAINGFNVIEVFLLSGMSKAKKNIRVGSRIFIIVLGLTDAFTFAGKDVDLFIRYGNWTTWVANPAYGFVRSLHSVIVVLTIIDMFILGVIWYKNNKLKRQRKFIRYVFVANFIMAFFTIPDTLMPLIGARAISTSGIGAALCTVVIWYGASILNSFDISIGNVFDNIYKFVDAGVLVFDIDYCLALANPYGQKLIGEGNSGKIKLEDIFLVSDDQKDIFFTGTLDGIVADRFEGLSDHKIYSVKNTVAMDDHGEPYCYICVAVEITDVISMVNELEAANNAKTKFLTSISHEIRTPINAVLGFSEMIANQTDEPEIITCTQNISRAGDLLLSIINDLLDMGKISSGNMDIIPAEYDLAKLLSDVYFLHSVKVVEKGLSFFLLNDESIPKKLFGDSLRIQQVITNLLTNAIKYTKEGSVTLNVEYYEKENDLIDLCITITDTGIGIKEEDIPYLFDVFTRFDSNENKHIEGTGVGLSITQSLVEGMDGKIQVESKYGVGSRFIVTIPQRIVSREPIGKISTSELEARKKETLEFIAPHALVLVVDDNPMNLMVFGGLVKPLEINVDTASDAATMLEMIKNKKYDIIFLDHMMPGMDGIEALQHMRADKEHMNQDTPVIVMTANCIKGAREEYLNLGFDDFVGKPVQMSVLAETIRKYINENLVIASEKEVDDTANSDSVADVFNKQIEGIDWNMALKTMPDKNFLVELIKNFYVMAQKETLELSRYFDGISDDSTDADGNETDYLAEYRIKVHAMKNSLALVGAASTSDFARRLEYAARDKDTGFIVDNHNAFIEEYMSISRKLEIAITGEVMPEESRIKIMYGEELLANLEKMKKAMDDFDLNALNDMSFALEEYSFENEEISSLVGEVQTAILSFDQDQFEAALSKIREKV